MDESRVPLNVLGMTPEGTDFKLMKKEHCHKCLNGKCSHLRWIYMSFFGKYSGKDIWLIMDWKRKSKHKEGVGWYNSSGMVSSRGFLECVKDLKSCPGNSWQGLYIFAASRSQLFWEWGKKGHLCERYSYALAVQET